MRVKDLSFLEGLGFSRVLLIFKVPETDEFRALTNIKEFTHESD